MGKNKKIRVTALWDDDYLSWLDEDKFVSVGSIAYSDIVLFTGGSDVNPEMYGENKGSFTYVSEKRDRDDQRGYDQIMTRGGKFLVGICRGAQFLTVKAGGSLFQDVTGHAIHNEHGLEIKYDFLKHVDEDISRAAVTKVEITSTHHQMMNPYDLPVEAYRMVASSEGVRSAYYLNGDNTPHETWLENPSMSEPEIVMYDYINALCIQGHPERLDKKSITVKFLNNLLLHEYEKFRKEVKGVFRH